MKILSLISRLIDYPDEMLVLYREEYLQMVADDANLSDQDKQDVTDFINNRLRMDILDWQSEYDGLFERGRSLSLLLFEHVHGESRDRGQAMIDLIQQYKSAGLDIGVRELPDYIPLFLEFLSTQGDENAQGWLQDVSHILGLLAVRLAKRDSNYATLFRALVHLSGAQINYEDLSEQIKDEKRDDTNEALDKVWEEEMVKFGQEANAEQGCPSGQYRPSESQSRDKDVPIQFVDAAARKPASNPAVGDI